jgi:hypothetical protein
MQNPHIAAYYAYLIKEIQLALKDLNIKVKFNYGVFDNIVLFSLTFLTNNKSLKLITDMLIDKCFILNLNPAVQLLESINLAGGTVENMEESMRWSQKSANMLFMSGINATTFKDI